MKTSTAYEAGIAVAAGASIIGEIIKPHMSPLEQGLTLGVFAIFSTLAAVSSDEGAENFKPNAESTWIDGSPLQ